MPKRILGDQRIFQSVYNDLGLTHAQVTMPDGSSRWVYFYDGTDPYELEDNHFPRTVAAIKAAQEGEV